MNFISPTGANSWKKCICNFLLVID